MAANAKMNDDYHRKVNTTHLELALTGSAVDSIEDTASSKFTWLVAMAASVGGMLFGYDTGIISAVLVYIDSDLGHELQSNEKELITSLCSGGAFIGAIVAGLTADRYGRKGAIYAG
jgi:SP family myo-inositol transporter-like MFS transporter 13